MRYITPFLLALILLSACTPQAESTEASLKSKLDSLNTVHATAALEIKEIEAQLAEMDTTRSLTEVTTMTASTKRFQHYFTVQGSLEADKNALIYPESQGIVKQIYVKEGQQVSKGTQIIRLDAAVMSTQIQELETSLTMAKDVFSRQERLWNQNIGSEIQYLEAKNRKESLENSLATMKQQLGKSVVRAPFAGTIDDILPKVGEIASPGMPVARIVNVKEVYLKTEISERYLGKVQVGDSVVIEFPGVKTVMGTVQRTGNYINPDSRSFEVVVDVNNKNGELKPNMLAKLTINDYTADKVIVLPSPMIQQDTQGNSFVYAVEKSGAKAVATKVMIEPGVSYKGSTEILSGLELGQQVVDKGARKVSNGEEVEINNPAVAQSR